jgi:hypothetical protein
MESPPSLQTLIDAEIHQLTAPRAYSPQRDSRIRFYAAIGDSNVMDDKVLDESRRNNTLPALCGADCVRAWIALRTARKVERLWEQACSESDAALGAQQDSAEIRQEEETYQAQRKQKHLEHISVYDVPRAHIPAHILEMAELALHGEIHDVPAFREHANEWWQIYGRPEQMERECFIKWAAQDALYEAIGWIKHNHKPPAEHAVLAFAGVFEGESFLDRRCTLNEDKQHEFWMWWLGEAIPQAIAEANRH